MTRQDLCTPAEARDFFERLAAYSAEFVKVTLSPIHHAWPSSNYYDDWKYDHPIGHVLHYTAGVSFSGTIRHFVTEKRSSSNWVVAKSLDPRFDKLRKDLDLARDLRAEVVQIVPPQHPSWHAGFVNRWCAGTEVRNAGILRPCKKGKKPHPNEVTHDTFFSFNEDVDDLDFYWWANGWTAPFKGEVLRVQNGSSVSWWESWSRGSIATVITLMRYLNALYEGSLDPVWTLAHHNVNPAKNDIVLPVPVHKIREAVLFSREHVDNLEWLTKFDDSEDGFEVEDDPWLLREMNERQGDRADEDLSEFDPRKITGIVDTPAEVTSALKVLGYWTKTDDDVRRSIRIYQQSRSLDVTGHADSKTCQILDREIRKWRIL